VRRLEGLFLAKRAVILAALDRAGPTSSEMTMAAAAARGKPGFSDLDVGIASNCLSSFQSLGGCARRFSGMDAPARHGIGCAKVEVSKQPLNRQECPDEHYDHRC
jgi:hypothetical protein